MKLLWKDLNTFSCTCMLFEHSSYGGCLTRKHTGRKKKKYLIKFAYTHVKMRRQYLAAKMSLSPHKTFSLSLAQFLLCTYCGKGCNITSHHPVIHSLWCNSFALHEYVHIAFGQILFKSDVLDKKTWFKECKRRPLFLIHCHEHS